MHHLLRSSTCCSLLLLLLFALHCVSSSSLAAQSHRYMNESERYLQNILHFYGNNASITVSDLQDLVLMMSVRPPEDITDENPLQNEHVSGGKNTFMECSVV